MIMFALKWPDYVVFVALLVSYACVGIWFGYSNQLKRFFRKCCNTIQHATKPAATTDEIFLGNRKLTLLPIIGTSMASFLSAVSLLGTNSEVYLNGIEFGIMIIAYSIAFPLAAEIYMPVFYKLNLLSSNEYLEMRFSKLVRWIVTVVFTLQMIVYISVVLYAPSLALSQATGWNMYIAVIATGLLATFYTTIGGIRAVVWTDLIQVIVMLIGFIMVVAFGSFQLGGFENVVKIANEGRRLNLFNFDPNPFTRHSFFSLAFGGAGMVLSIYATNQAQVQRYLACKDLNTAKIAIHVNLPLNAIFLVLQILCGLVAYATFVGCDPKMNGEISAYDQVLPYLILKLFYDIPVIRGIFISSIFAAALSTLSSGINSVACVLVEDILMEVYTLFYNGAQLKQKTLTLIARLLAVLIGVVTIFIAFILSVVPSGVLQISFSIFGAVGGPIMTVFTIGMLMPFVNKWGGLLGFLASLTTGLTLTIGSIFQATYKQISEIPLTNTSCGATSTSFTFVYIRGTNVTASNNISFNFFNISYLYYSPVCLLVGVLVATAVSLLTGMSTKAPVSKSLMAWQAVSLYARLPSCMPPQSCDTVVTSAHQDKLTAMLMMEDDNEMDLDIDKTSISASSIGMKVQSLRI